MQQSTNRPATPPDAAHTKRLQGCLPSYKTILKIEGAILIVVGIASLLLSWDFGLSLTWVGIGAIAFGGMSLVGGFSITRNFAYQQAQSVGPLNQVERAQAELKERGGQFEFLVLMLIVGILTIFLGFIASILTI
ncbi:MAG: hypothetical protein K8L91_32355 [Anaerolineae bacterium]|nr:hypothetical protein [Anaerolineae bacterium]